MVRESACRTEELTVNWNAQAKFITGKKRLGQSGCTDTSAEIRVSELVDGFPVYWDFSQRKKAERSEAWNPIYRDWVHAGLRK